MGENMNNGEYEKNLKETFKVFDKNQDGFITRFELKKAMQKLQPDITDDEIGEMLSEADINQDGKIDYEGYFFLEFFCIFGF